MLSLYEMRAAPQNAYATRIIDYIRHGVTDGKEARPSLTSQQHGGIGHTSRIAASDAGRAEASQLPA